MQFCILCNQTWGEQLRAASATRIIGLATCLPARPAFAGALVDQPARGQLEVFLDEHWAGAQQLP